MKPWIGFNFQWMYSWTPEATPDLADERVLDFMANHGFNFARSACDYRFWTRDFNYFEPVDSVIDSIEGHLKACQSRGIHFSLNMHRVPGYCINRPDIEKHNLWEDREAQDGFVFQWGYFAKRFKGVSPSDLSFDLVNEPPNIRQFGMTRESHSALIRRVVQEIRSIDPDRKIVIDGLEGGHIAMPELADLGVVHSGRGYQPMPVSHQGADWWDGWKGYDAVYPGGDWWGQEWNKQALHEFYKPWRDVSDSGCKVHIGEFGCYNQTDNETALRWFSDLVGLYRSYGWGWALWGFDGPFGIVDHGRPGTQYETMDGFRLDRALFELLKP